MLESLKGDISTAKELLLGQHLSEHVEGFKERHPIEWVDFSAKNVLRCLEAEDSQACSVLKLVVELIEQE